MDTSGWERYFASAADTYDDEPFTKATEAELDLLTALLEVPPGARVLDIGCGTGRHAVPLAAAGYQVTGIDQSPAMLAKAEERARAAGVGVELITADARDLPDMEPFDAAICLCEGAFCLVADGVGPFAYDRAVLASAHRTLRRGGRFVLTALNAARMLTAWRSGEVEGEVDLLTLTTTSPYSIAEGTTLMLREHYHLPEELRMLAESVGFEVEAVWAGGAGDWRREPPTPDDYELMMVASRPWAP